jgi:hypothetical protein
MKLEKRWGKKYKDKRNWKEYNKELVFRGEILINPVFLKNWNKEVNQMNARKIGQPYLYPESMIEFLAVLHCKGIDFRGLQGLMKGLSDNFKYQFPVIDYSQICRRFNKLKTDFEVLPEDTDDYLIAGLDGSGEKSTKRGGWMREHYKVRKGWIKVTIMGVKNKKGKKYVIDIRVGNEKTDEKAATRSMIRNKQKNIGILYADGFHDCKDTFNLCDKYGIATGIKIREKSSIKTRKSARRREEVKIYQSMPYEEWAREKKYGTRWVVTEGIFSACKRIYGEYVSATKKRNMYHEVKVKFWAYNKLVSLKK